MILLIPFILYDFAKIIRTMVRPTTVLRPKPLVGSALQQQLQLSRLLALNNGCTQLHLALKISA
jgi:hypothetical protein